MESTHSSLLFKLPNGRCWICGSRSNLTREHKIKRTEAKKLFSRGSGNLQVHHNPKEFSIAQGPSSSVLKFKNKICNKCNSFTTQSADNAFDKYMNALSVDAGVNKKIANQAETQEFVQPDIHLGRYFAKLIGSHIADNKAPIPRKLAKFAGCLSQRNQIWLKTTQFDISDAQNNWSRRYFPNSLDLTEPFAAHGSVVIFMDGSNNRPEFYLSSLTVDGFHHIFKYVFSRIEILDLICFQSAFLKRCRNLDAARRLRQFSTSSLE